jgi:hypothetical protein
MFAPQTNPASPAVLMCRIPKGIRKVLFDSRDVYPLPCHLFPVYRFFFPVASLASFGVRVYVSIVTGGSLTTQIIPAKPSFQDGVSTHIFRGLVIGH